MNSALTYSGFYPWINCGTLTERSLTNDRTHCARCRGHSQSYRHLTEQPKGRVSATAGFLPAVMASSAFLRS